jgi:hypothetical protein
MSFCLIFFFCLYFIYWLNELKYKIGRRGPKIGVSRVLGVFTGYRPFIDCPLIGDSMMG